MKIGRGRDGHDDEFGQALEVMGWWIRTGETYSPFPKGAWWIVTRAFWTLVDKLAGRFKRWELHFEPKPRQECVAYAQLTFEDDSLVPDPIEPFEFTTYTRWGAERLRDALGPSHRGSFYLEPIIRRRP
jgi:hypothetical protein